MARDGAGPRIQLLSSGYRIALGEGPDPDEVSAEFDFGEPAEAVLGGQLYVAYVDVPGGGTESADVESGYEFWLYKAEPVEGDPEEIADEGEGEEDEDEGEDGGVEVTVGEN